MRGLAQQTGLVLSLAGQSLLLNSGGIVPTLPNTYALIVGIASYQHSTVNPLPSQVLADAQAIRAVLVDPTLCAYPAETVTLLLNEQASGRGLRQALTALAQQTNADSTVLLYCSCHGARIAQGAHAGEYLLPVDANAASAQTLAASALAGDEFAALIQAIPARKMLIILDCCHAGGIGILKDALAPLLQEGFSPAYYEKLSAGRGRAI